MDQQSPLNNNDNDNPRTTNRGSRLERLWKSSHPWQAEHETEDDEVEVLEHGCASPLSPKRSTKRSALGPAPSVRSPAAAFQQRWQERPAAVRGGAEQEQEQITAVPSLRSSQDDDDEDVKMMIKMMEQQQQQQQQAQSTQPSNAKTKVKPKVKSTKNKKTSSSRRQRIQQQQQQQTPLPLAPPNNATTMVNDPEPASDMELLDIDFDADANALRQAIADEILAMWSAQGLYQDMPELRHEILNHVVEQKLTALQQDQQRLREQLILSGGYLNDGEGEGLPSLSSSSAGISASNVAKRMSIIAEASDEDDDSEWDDEDDDEEELDQQRLVATVTDDEQDNNNNYYNHNHNIIPQQQQRRYSQEEEQIAYNAFNVLQELQERVEGLDTHNHYCVEAMGCWGQLPPADIPIRDHHAFDKYKLREAVEQRVSQIFTDDHHVVSSFDQDDEAGDDGKEEKNDSQPQQQQSVLQNNQQDSSSSTVPVKQQLKEGLSKSFSTFDHLLQAKLAKDMADDEWTEYTVTEASAVTTTNNTNSKKTTALPTTAKRISVDSAKTIRRSNSRESSLSGGEEYEEYTVDQASFMEYTVKSNGSTTVVDVDDLSEQREREKQQRQQQQQQHLAHGSSPCSKDNKNKATWAEETTPIKRNASSPVTMEGLLVSSRVLSDLQVPSTTMSPPRANSSNNNTKEQPQHQHALDLNNGSFPTITTTMFDDQDDDLTQITFDQTMEGATSITQDHQHATTYLNRNMKKNHQQQQQHNNNNNSSNRNKTHQSPPRKYHSAVDSQQTETTRDTTTVQGLRDDSENSNNHNDKASVSSSVDSHTAALLAKSVAKILRVDIWSLNAAVVLGALETLGHAASYGSTLRANIARLGGVIAVLRAMQVHPHHVPIQIAACVVLEELSVDRETQVAIGEVGGIPAIVAAMQGHLEDHQVQVAGCKVLANITNPQPAEDTPSEDNNGNDNDDDDDDIPADGAVAALVASMTRHATDPEIQAKAFAALANLCLDHPGRLQELSETGGLTAMTLALQRPWKNKMDQHEAISTLSILLRSLAELDTSSS